MFRALTLLGLVQIQACSSHQTNQIGTRCGAPSARCPVPGVRCFGGPGGGWMGGCPAPDGGTCWLSRRPVTEDLALVYAEYYTHAESALAGGLLSSLFRGAREGYLQLWGGYSRGVGGLRQRLLAPFMLLHPQGLWQVRRYSMFLKSRGAAGRLLDVGCGSGLNLDRMRALGWVTRGVDFDARAVEAARARGLDVTVGDVFSPSFGDATFDAVFLGHVIEHVTNPAETIRECFRVLAPGGSLVMVTPNAASWGHRLFGADWRGLEPPRHLQVFTRKGLALAVQKAGFRTADVRAIPGGAGHGFAMSRLQRRWPADRRIAQRPLRPWGPRALLDIGLERLRSLIDADAGSELLAIARK